MALDTVYTYVTYYHTDPKNPNVFTMSFTTMGGAIREMVEDLTDDPFSEKAHELKKKLMHTLRNSGSVTKFRGGKTLTVTENKVETGRDYVTRTNTRPGDILFYDGTSGRCKVELVKWVSHNVARVKTDTAEFETDKRFLETV